EHVRAHNRIEGDLQEADWRFAAATGRGVSVQNASDHPEAAEDPCPRLVRAIHELGSTAQLNRRWWNEPGEPSRDRHHDCHIRVVRDVARSLKMSPRHDIEHNA